MKRLKLLYRVLKTTNMTKFLSGFLIYFFTTAIILLFVDPNINTLGDSIWYCFVSCTTLGYGDVVAGSVLGKIMTMILTVYGVLLIGFIPGVIVSYFTEFNKIKSNESVMAFLDKLEHLDELSKEELRELSEKIRQKRFKL